MGEVYRARDTRLNRHVAVKVVSEHVARFEREARAIAALSHPNIVAIFDTGVHEGRMFVVMELLSGRTLREAIGGMELRKAVDTAIQIARGLGAAHDKGIVHRDLKPENVFLLDDGQVKILDFGLARQVELSAPDASTTAVAGTEHGIVMGTLGYMAPEQLRGQVADARADLFAFGAVLYEMVSGGRAFQKSTTADTVTAILTEEPPDLLSLEPGVPRAVDRVIRHCLEKIPGERFQSARDVAFTLESLTDSVDSTSLPVQPAQVRRRWTLPAALVAASALSAAFGVAFERGRQQEPARVAFEAKTWDRQEITNARFGSDGRTIVFSAAKAGSVPSLYLIPPGGVVPQPIGEPGTHLLAVSAKGEIAAITGARLAHHRIYSGTLSRMTLEGAARAWIEDVSEADFTPDGTALAVIRSMAGRWQLEYPVGTVLYTAGTGYISDLRISPDAARVAFFDHPAAEDNRGMLKVVDTQKRITELSGEYPGLEGLAWTPDGKSVLFTPADSNAHYSVMVAPIDGTPPRQVLAGPGYSIVSDLSADGRLLLTRGDDRYSLRGQVPGETVEREFPWLDYPLFPSVSRDGRYIAFEDASQSAGADYQVALRNVAANTVSRLGPGTALGVSPDGAWVAAQVPSTLKIQFYPTGVGDPLALDRGPIDLTRYAVEWFSNSARVLYCGREPSTRSRCYAQDIKGGPADVVTPDDVTEAVLASDDRTLLIRRGQSFQVLKIGGTPVDARGFTPSDRLLTWNATASGVVVADGTLPARIDLVDPSSGLRTRLKDLTPPDGVVFNIHWLPDGRGYAYSYSQRSGQLFIVTGWRR
jgi:dipeptidyl aminopeptidase/acylaminoacyl peptidase/predicted Ser/Thr protein kinase